MPTNDVFLRFRFSAHVFVVIFVAIFVGCSISLFGTYAGVLFGLILLASLFYLLLSSTSKNYSGHFFLLVLSSFFILPLIKKITHLPVVGLWQLFIALFVFGLARFFRVIKNEIVLWYGLLAFFIFLAIVAISTFSEKAHLWPASYQLLSDLKPLAILIAGFSLSWSDRLERMFWAIIEWVWLPIIMLIAFEWFAPSLYFTVFDGELSLDPTGIFPSRAVGPFQFPSLLATTGAMFALLIYARLQVTTQKTWIDWFRLLAYVAIILFSVQRQELLAVFLSAGLIYICAEKKRVFRRGLIAILFLIIAIVLYSSIYLDNIIKEAALWGIGNFKDIEHPRAQIYWGAFNLAVESFPFGTGLGTYGGAGADKFDQSLYYELGFGRYWWFGKESFLMDTYWPNSIAEAGFFGALFLLLSYLMYFFYALKQSVFVTNNAKKYWLFCSSGILYLLLISFTSPAFQDPMLSFLPLLVIGLASTDYFSYEKKAS